MAGCGRQGSPSIEHFVGTYCVHRIDTDQGRPKEAQENAFPEGDKKGLKKDHMLCWGQVPGAKRLPRRMSETLRLKDNVDDGRGRRGKSAYYALGAGRVLHTRHLVSPSE